MFYHIKPLSATETIDARFDLFVQKILPQYQDNSLNRVLIYVPSYFDFVRLRNYFIAEMIDRFEMGAKLKFRLFNPHI